MSSRALRYCSWLMLSALLFAGCSEPQFILAPAGTVPTRDELPKDVYGGYITIISSDSTSLSGELIGLRNDTLFVLSDSLASIHRDSVVRARLIVHSPNNYRMAGYIITGASGLVIVHTAEYGEGPLLLGLASMLLNSIGLISAQETENKIINYYDWPEGWDKAVLYSRFPQGIPTTLNVLELSPREKNK